MASPHATGAPAAALEALRARLLEQLGEIRANEPGTRLGRDPENLHDMRVAVRRARALLRSGRKLVADDTAELEARLRRLGQDLGAARDLDVLLARLRAGVAELPDDERAAAQPAITALARDRSASQRRLLQTLDSDGYRELLAEMERTVGGLRSRGSDVTLAKLATRQAKKLRKAAKSLPDNPSDEQLHGLRKAGKRVRYAAELAGRRRVVKRAKKLQDVLGEHQDAVVAAERLRALGAPSCLVDREEARRDETRAAWPKAWKRLRKVT